MSRRRPSDLVDATRQLALLVRLGYPLAEGLKTMATDASPYLADLGDRLEQGDTLSEAVRRFPRLFSPFYAAMVESAEASGDTAAVLRRLSDWLEQAEQLRHELATALYHPFLVFNALLIEVWVMFHYAVPQVLVPLAHTVAHAGPGVLQLLHQAGAVLGDLALVALVAANVVAAFKGLDLGLLAAVVPGASRLAARADQALWCRALATLLAAGTALPEALDRAASVCQTRRVADEMRLLAERTGRGGELSASLAEASDLDPYLAWCAVAGEQREELPAVLFRAAEHLEERVTAQARHRLRMAEPWALGLLGVLTLVIVVAFWWPFYSWATAIR